MDRGKRVAYYKERCRVIVANHASGAEDRESPALDAGYERYGRRDLPSPPEIGGAGRDEESRAARPLVQLSLIQPRGIIERKKGTMHPENNSNGCAFHIVVKRRM